MDERVLAGIAVVGSIALACGCLVWLVYAEVPSRDEHLFREPTADRHDRRHPRTRQPAPLSLRIIVTALSVGCVATGVAGGAATLPLILAGGSTLLVWIARPRTSYGRRLSAATDRSREQQRRE